MISDYLLEAEENDKFVDYTTGKIYNTYDDFLKENEEEIAKAQQQYDYDKLKAIYA